MSTPKSVLDQMDELIEQANATTGAADTTLTAAVNRLIKGYGTQSGGSDGETECEHLDSEARYEDNGNGTHKRTRVCIFCGEVLDETNEACTTKQTITDNGNGTHTIKNTCTKCGSVTEAEASCADTDGDLLCDVCGAHMPCLHASYDWGHDSNGDGTHTSKKECKTCREVLETEVTACTDDNSDGRCDVCGGVVQTVCTHTSREETWTFNGGKTHRTKVVCRNCGEIIKDEDEACTDSNGDGKCDVCAGVLDTGVWSYASGELNGVYQYAFSVKDNVLRCTKPDGSTSGVAVGAVSGDTESLVSNKQIRAIPIPKAASKLVFTAGDTNTRGVKAVFIKGEPNEVTEDSGLPTDDATPVTNKVCTISFERGKWDYVALNLTGTWPSVATAPYAGTKATLVFLSKEVDENGRSEKDQP